MIERTGQDWQALCAALGQVQGDLLTYQRVVAERDTEIQDLRAQLAAALNQLDKPPDDTPAEGGA